MMPHVKRIPLEGRKIPALHVRRSLVKHLDLIQLTDYIRGATAEAQAAAMEALPRSWRASWGGTRWGGALKNCEICVGFFFAALSVCPPCRAEAAPAVLVSHPLPDIPRPSYRPGRRPRRRWRE